MNMKMRNGGNSCSFKCRGKINQVLILLAALAPSFMEGKPESRIWTLSVPYSRTAHSYLDENGFLQGFARDMIERVCAEAKMDCRMVLELSSTCWMTHPVDKLQSGGIGLFGRRYDACTTVVPSILRIQIFQFTKPHFKTYPAYLFVLKGANINHLHLEGKKIGYNGASIQTPECIQRQGVVQGFDKVNAVPYDNKHVMFEALISRQVDAILALEPVWNSEQEKQMDRLEPKFQCAAGAGGFAMMSRKDSAFTANWNVGLTKLMNTNEWATFCAKTILDHNMLPSVCED